MDVISAIVLRIGVVKTWSLKQRDQRYQRYYTARVVRGVVRVCDCEYEHVSCTDCEARAE